MGFDLGGIKPCAEVGIYFRNNIWWWHPLADYILEVCADLFSPGEEEHWHTNDGHRVSAGTATTIATRLKQLIETGAVREYAAQYRPEQTEDPLAGWMKRAMGPEGGMDPSEHCFSEKNVADFAEFCENSGGFVIC